MGFVSKDKKEEMRKNQNGKISASDTGGNPRERDTPRSPGERTFKKKERTTNVQKRRREGGNNYVNVSKGKDENWIELADTGNLENEPKNTAAKGPQLTIYRLL